MSASKAELWTQLSNIIKISDETIKFGIANTPNFLTLLDTLTQSLEGTHAPTTMVNLSSFRNSLASLASNSSILTACVLELAKQGYNSRATSLTQALQDIFDGMTAATETVKNRAWTYGSLTTPVGNVGTGIPYRLISDISNQQIEAGAYNGGTVKLEITNDKNTGATEGVESASVYGSGVVPTDALELGTAPSGTLFLNATRSEDGKLTNSSFETYTGSGATLAFTGWTTTTPASSAANTSIYFRKNPGLTTGTSIEFTADNSITQWISSATSRINPLLPTFLIVRYRRKNSCDGTLTISMGTKTSSVVLTTKTDATWYDLTVGTTGSDGWYNNFKEDNVGLGFRVIIALASRTTGELLIDNVILAQPSVFDGKYYLLTSGATDFLKGDYFTWADTVSNTGRIQTTLSRLFGAYMPHTSGSPTYADA